MIGLGLVPAPEVLRAAIASTLGGAQWGALAEHRELTPEAITAAHAHRVQGLLWSALEAESVDGNENLTSQAKVDFVDTLRACLAVEELTVIAVDALASAGVAVRILKGVAIAHLDHADPATRLFGDVDLLVRPLEHKRALLALSSVGITRVRPPVRGWWERRFGKAVVLRAQSGAELDLHLRLTGGFFGERIDHDFLWLLPGEPFRLAGRSVEALDREMRLLHACLHVALGANSGLRAIHDVAHLVIVRQADWAATVEHAAANGVDAVIAEALRTTWAELALDLGHPCFEWANQHKAPPDQLEALSTYRTSMGGGGWAPEGRGTLAALGTADRALFLFGLAVPSLKSRRARKRTLRDHVRQGRQALR